MQRTHGFNQYPHAPHNSTLQLVIVLDTTEKQPVFIANTETSKCYIQNKLHFISTMLPIM